MTFLIAIIGRPNVGKSTLFNRLTGTKHAIVHDMPGVTRDRKQHKASIGPLDFEVIDTPGLEEAPEDSLLNRMMLQTSFAVDEANMVIMLVDGKSGLLPDDKFFADWVRKKNKSVILVVNKCEAKLTIQNIHEFYSLGLGEPACISAEHGEGLVNLYDLIAPQYEIYQQNQPEVENEDNDKHIQLAIVGRPNAGKSTLMNKLLNEERVLTGPEAGITRDAIAIDWQYKGKNIRLIDTAGLRRKSKVESKLEKLSFEDSLRAIQYAHVVVLLTDANAPLEGQDLYIANLVLDEGRALIIAVNKWDSIENKTTVVNDINYKLETNLPQIRGVPILYISALNGSKINEMVDASLEIYKFWNYRASTAKLNEWLAYALEKHQLPLSPSGKRLKIKYATQSKSRPPTLVLFTTFPSEIPESYIRYLIASFRDYFKIPGIVVRVLFKKPDNPYKNKKKFS
jgi:GTP-binding protein